MTRDELETRVKYWQIALSELGLAHWRADSLTVVDECDGGSQETVASVNFSEDYDTFDIQVKKDHLEEKTATVIDETLVHELLHVAFRDLENVEKHAETWLPEASWTDHASHLSHAREGVIERLARLIVRLHSECGTVSP